MVTFVCIYAYKINCCIDEFRVNIPFTFTSVHFFTNHNYHFFYKSNNHKSGNHSLKWNSFDDEPS